MAQDDNFSKIGTIQITMDRKFSKFKKDDKKKFENDLSTLGKTSKKDIKGKKYKRGCVCFEGELNQSIIDNLLKWYENRNDCLSDEHTVDFNKFMKKHSVNQIVQKSKIYTITSKKSPSIVTSIRDSCLSPNKQVFEGIESSDYDSLKLYQNDNFFYTYILKTLYRLFLNQIHKHCL